MHENWQIQKIQEIPMIEKTTPKVHYEADRDLMADGYHLCGHQHKTLSAAKRCLPPNLPRQSGSLTQAYSRATIHRFEGGLEARWTEDDADEWFSEK